RSRASARSPPPPDALPAAANHPQTLPPARRDQRCPPTPPRRLRGAAETASQTRRSPPPRPDQLRHPAVDPITPAATPLRWIEAKAACPGCVPVGLGNAGGRRAILPTRFQTGLSHLR